MRLEHRRTVLARVAAAVGLALGILVAGNGLRSAVADDDSAALEIARLKRKLAEKDQVIDRLNAELAVRKSTPPADPALSRSRRDDDPAVAPQPPPPQPMLSERDLALTPPEQAFAEALRPDGRLSDHTDLFDNFSLFAGIDGSKQPQDFGVNALFGGVSQLNWGIPLFREYNIGVQVGTGINGSYDAVQVFDRVQGTKGRLQSFTTLGLYQRSDSGWRWGAGYDLLYEQYFDHVHLGQWRGELIKEIDLKNEIGGRLMLRGYGADATFGKTALSMNSINMGTLYYNHVWNSGVSTGFWAGLADKHNELNAALGPAGIVRTPFVWGAQVRAPLNEYCELFGQANFIAPPSTGTVDAFLGIAFYPVPKSVRERSKRFAPVLPVANNPTFAVDLGPRR